MGEDGGGGERREARETARRRQFRRELKAEGGKTWKKVQPVTGELLWEGELEADGGGCEVHVEEGFIE